MEKIVLNRRIFMALPVVLAACKGGPSVLDFAGATMGTTFSVKAIDPTGKVSEENLRNAVQGALTEANRSLSNWDAASEVSRFNAAQTTDPIKVSAPLYDVARAAEDVRRASEGRFDVALGPLIELWGFGASSRTKSAPTDAEIEHVLAARQGKAELTFGEGTIRKSHPRNEIFLSAIGKWHGVDMVAKAVRGLGIHDFMVEIGGDLYTSGRNQDGLAWRIGVETPSELGGGVQQVVNLKTHGMATSGDYRNYFEVDGQRYSHILDAESGRPITHRTASATVVTENAMLADAWATAMLVLGSVKGLKIAEANDLAVFFVDRNDDGFAATASSTFATLTS